MTTPDPDPQTFGQPAGFPPADPYGPPQGAGYPPPPAGYPAAPPPGYAPAPPPGYGPPPGYAPPPPPGYQPVANPYGAPGGYYPGNPPTGLGAQPGHIGRRLGARFIDGLIVGAVAGVLASLFNSSSSILVTGFFTGVLMFVYFVAMEATQSRTLGKMLLGLSVRGPGGAPKPTLQQSAIRNAFTLLPIVPFIGGLLSIIAIIVIAVTIENSPTKQGKHDEMAGGTQVVKL